MAIENEAEIFAKMKVHEPMIAEYMAAIGAKKIAPARPQAVFDHGALWVLNGQFPLGGTEEKPIFAIIEEILDTGAEIELFMRASGGTPEAPKVAFLTYTVGTDEAPGIVKLWNIDGWIKHRARLSKESLYNFGVTEGIIVDTETCARCETKNDPDFVYCKRCGEAKDDDELDGEPEGEPVVTPPNGGPPALVAAT